MGSGLYQALGIPQTVQVCEALVWDAPHVIYQVTFLFQVDIMDFISL